MKITHGLGTLLALALALTPTWAAALPYPCPSDPGFCYRDYGNDGCFDVGVDDGPINAVLEAQWSFPPVPDPGSIVCPPSVEQLTPTSFSIRLATNPGSSILIYAATIETPVGVFGAISGDRLLLGGAIAGGGTETLSGEGDVFLDKGLIVPKIPVPLTLLNRALMLQSVTGNVTVGPKARIRARRADILAGGDITFLEKVKLSAENQIFGSDCDLRVIAGGAIEMTRPKLTSANTSASSVIEIEGASVTFHEAASIRGFVDFVPQRLEIIATAGDVTIDKLSLKTDIFPAIISGTNVMIGTMQGGKPPRSSINQRFGPVDILATDTIQIDNLRLRSEMAIQIETTGTQVEILRSSLGGLGANPTIEISATGAGSTCDLTGTKIVDATLVTNCDTVIGP